MDFSDRSSAHHYEYFARHFSDRTPDCWAPDTFSITFKGFKERLTAVWSREHGLEKQKEVFHMKAILLAGALTSLTGCVAVDQSESNIDLTVRHDLGPEGEGLGLPFSKAVSAGDIIFLSGELGIKPGSRTPIPGGAGPETTQIFQNIEATLKRNGASLGDIVKCTVFL